MKEQETGKKLWKVEEKRNTGRKQEKTDTRTKEMKKTNKTSLNHWYLAINKGSQKKKKRRLISQP